MKRILITGANSYVGTSFEKWVAANRPDFQVDTLSLRDPKWHDYDFSKYDAVFHVAGIAHVDVGTVDAQQQLEYYRVNTDLTVSCAKKSLESGVSQFIFMSSIIVYGDSQPVGSVSLITRDTPLAPAGFYGDSKKRAEEELQKLVEGQAMKLVILRPPMIYGPGAKGNYGQLAKMARLLPIFPDVRNCRSMLYIDNLCCFVSLMIQNEEEGIFFPQNKKPVKTAQLVEEISLCHGKSIYRSKALRVPVYLGSKMDNKIGELINKAFGNLVYDPEISKYKEKYQLYGLRASVRRTEQVGDPGDAQVGEQEAEAGLGCKSSRVCNAGSTGFRAGKTPTVSIVTICFNSEEDIERTMQSVLNQTHTPTEYLIVDGGSKDQTVEIAESFRKSMEAKGIRFSIVSEPDEGIYDAMNKGIARANGEIVGILNAGDWYEHDTVAKTVSMFRQTGCDLTFGDIRLHRQNGSTICKRAHLRRFYQTSRDWNHPTMFVCTSLSKANPYLKKGIHDDYGFYLKMMKAGAKIRVIPGVLANFQMGGASNHKSLEASKKRIRDRYAYCYRCNGYSPLYMIECIGIELVKYLLG